MCSSIGRCLITRINHINSTCVRAATAVVANSSRTLLVLLRHSQWFISQIMRQPDRHPRHRHRCRHETCISSSHDLSTIFEGLRHVSSSTQVVVRAHFMFHNACASSQNFLLPASSSVWNRFADKGPLVNLAHDLREEATRQSGVVVFLAVSVHQEELCVDHLTAHSNVAPANQDTGACQSSTKRLRSTSIAL